MISVCLRFCFHEVYSSCLCNVRIALIYSMLLYFLAALSSKAIFFCNKFSVTFTYCLEVRGIQGATEICIVSSLLPCICWHLIESLAYYHHLLICVKLWNHWLWGKYAREKTKWPTWGQSSLCFHLSFYLCVVIICLHLKNICCTKRYVFNFTVN